MQLWKLAHDNYDINIPESYALKQTLILPFTSFSTKLSTATFEGAHARTWKMLSKAQKS